MIRTHHHDEFPTGRMVDRKRQGGYRISVCLPARDEEATVGAIVAAVHDALITEAGLVDELIVVDDHSTDRTGEVAADAGATVVCAADVLPGYGRGPGKGQALWRSLHVSTGDLVVWCDADVQDFTPAYVTGLVGPLLANPDVVFVKGFYDRPTGPDGEGGGRVTELVARPLAALLHPQLSPIVQPLGGEYAGRREVLEQVPFVSGYGVDLGLLIDIVHRWGPGAVAQVDLGTRRHRNRPLAQLGPQALAVMQVALARRAPNLVGPGATITPAGGEPTNVAFDELPPLTSIPAHRRPSA